MINYYNYFLSLEKRFKKISNYVEVDERNSQTFSTEILLTFLATCSEFEVVSKELCEIIFPGFKGKYPKANIDNLVDIIIEHCPDIPSRTIELEFFEKSLEPLKGWQRGKHPTWWKAYNKIKHDRSLNYHLANLENLMLSLSALSLINHFFIWKTTCPKKTISAASLYVGTLPSYFRIKNVQYEGPWSADDIFDKIENPGNKA